MVARGWVLGAAASLLCALAGCWPNSSLWDNFDSRLSGAETLDGSPRMLAFQAQGALSKLNVYSKVTGDGDTFRVEASTPSNKKFALLLSKQESEEGEKTRIRIKWEDGSDTSFWLDFLSALRTSQPAAPQGAGGPGSAPGGMSPPPAAKASAQTPASRWP